MWFSADSIGTCAPSPDKVGLFGGSGSLRPAANTFQLVAQTIGHGYRFETASSSGPSLCHYLFTDVTREARLEALWAEGVGRVVTLTPRLGTAALSSLTLPVRSKSCLNQEGLWLSR